MTQSEVGPGLILIQAWISNHIHNKMWDEIIYPFLNFSGCTVEVWEGISNFDSFADLYWPKNFTHLQK